MLEVIINVDPNIRGKKRDAILKKSKTLSSEDVIYLDDINSTISILENYAFPSLFSLGTPVVHGKYLLEQGIDQLTKELLATIISSPTLFILEENSLANPIIKNIEKAGGFIHFEKPVKSYSKQSTIFSVTNAIVSTNKKDRWLSFRKALEDHAVEAIVGILYWKIRSMIEANPKDKSLKGLYTDLMKAHKDAWQKGFPLELAIEKVILEK